jgi:glycosyltransferase involved in cell wall biosynthesis
MKPLVSVVLCTYNQAVYLRDAVESVLGQTYPNVELLVIDNGSTDDSREVLEGYRGRHNVRLLLHPENAAVTARLNEAIRLSRGEYVSILYGDDYYLPEKLEVQVAAFADLPGEYGVVYSPGYRLNIETGQRWTDANFQASGSVLRELFVQSRGVNPVSPLVRRECFDRYPFHEDVFIEGEAIFFRLAMTYLFHHLETPLVVMREHKDNAGKAIRKNLESTLFLLSRLEREPDFPRECAADLRRFCARLTRDVGWQAVRIAADGSWARGCFRQAVRWRPGQLLHPRTVLGFGLSLLPRWALRRLIGVANRLRGHRGEVAIKEDYRIQGRGETVSAGSASARQEPASHP